MIFESPENNSQNSPSTFLEIENTKGKIGFFYYDENTDKFSLLKYNNNSQNLSLFENVTINSEGTVTATKFVGDGSGLYNLPLSEYWLLNGDNIYYNAGNIGIGTDSPQKTLQLKSNNQKPTIRLENFSSITSNKAEPIPDPTKKYWDIRMSQNTLNFDYTYFAQVQGQHTYLPELVKFEATNNSVEITVDGRIDAIEYFLDGEPFNGSQWNTGENCIYYESGNVGIGTEEPNAKFSVNNEFLVTEQGFVYARQIKVTQNNIPDYVFEPEYELISIDSLKNYVYTYSHLPEIPSAYNIEKNGMNLGEFNKLLLLKTEELTLYIFELQEQISKLEEQISEIQNEKK